MINFFREGGFGMWAILIGAVATFGLALTRPRAARPGIFATGCVLSLVLGMFGMASGMVAVSHGYAHFPDRVAALAEGLRELSNNGTFAAGLAILQGAMALVTARGAAREA
jgi:hypothetical protein